MRKERITFSGRCTSKHWHGKMSVAKVKRKGHDMQTPSERSLIAFIVRINFIVVTGKNTYNAFPTVFELSNQKNQQEALVKNCKLRIRKHKGSSSSFLV